MTTTPSAVTPAVRQALAYVAITGTFRKGTHIDTRLAARDYTVDMDYATTRRSYAVPDAKAYTTTPLWKAHTALLGAGFTYCGNTEIVRGVTHPTKTLRYERLDDALNGFSVTLYPKGDLYAQIVEHGKAICRKAATEWVFAAKAGTLPALLTSSEA